MSKAIITIPTVETLRYSGLLNGHEADAVDRLVGNIDSITQDEIGHLLHNSGQQELRGCRNIGPESQRRIRLWLAFHPNRRAWEAASGKLYDELNKKGIDPDQPAEASK